MKSHKGDKKFKKTFRVSIRIAVKCEFKVFDKKARVAQWLTSHACVGDLFEAKAWKQNSKWAGLHNGQRVVVGVGKERVLLADGSPQTAGAPRVGRTVPPRLTTSSVVLTLRALARAAAPSSPTLLSARRRVRRRDMGIKQAPRNQQNNAKSQKKYCPTCEVRVVRVPTC